MEKISKKVDIVGGKLTFYHRIELGKIIASGCDPAQALREVMRCLHGVEVDPKKESDLRGYVAYFEEIVRGISFWVEQEKRLRYDPTPEELQAGIRQMYRNIGEFGTLTAIAQAYAKDPDEVLQWEYGKVFGLLMTDFEKAKFQQRLQSIHDRKNRVGKWRRKR
ncbi:MAG: hypothetical protein LBJ57_02460 [Prevotellaceae bacterium]|jgi:hypothetical protein|nr:hypothetical protein [Prevotellaceae bacterium]